jgi:two-component system response regulator FixJ
MVVQSEPGERPVYIIDDDRDVRVALGLELRSLDIRSRPFASAGDFLEELPHLTPGCLLLDIRMPGKNGIELLAELAHRDIRWPVVMMTGHGEVMTAVQAMKLGALEFLEKPFAPEEMIAALDKGFQALDTLIGRTGVRAEARSRLATLTGREREVLEKVVTGLSNKEIGLEMGLSHRTVEMHRARLMRKLGTSRMVELLALAADAGLGTGRP